MKYEKVVDCMAIVTAAMLRDFLVRYYDAFPWPNIPITRRPRERYQLISNRLPTIANEMLSCGWVMDGAVLKHPTIEGLEMRGSYTRLRTRVIMVYGPHEEQYVRADRAGRV